VFKSIGAFIMKEGLNFLKKMGIDLIKNFFYSKKVDKEVKSVNKITDEIYMLEDKLEELEKAPELPLNVLDIEDIQKKIRGLENELRKAGVDLTGDIGSE